MANFSCHNSTQQHTTARSHTEQAGPEQTEQSRQKQAGLQGDGTQNVNSKDTLDVNGFSYLYA